MNGLAPKLLPRTSLVKTSEVDKAEWNFTPLFGIFQRLRFRMILSLLPKRRFHRLLEIGYGSGVFLPELARHCDELYAIDKHAKNTDVARSLEPHQIQAQLFSGSALELPFGNQMFDCIVAVSCLEYIDPLDRAAQEIARVLKTDGCLIFVTPGNSPVLDFGLYLLTGCRANEQYGKRRDFLVPTLMRTFVVQHELTAPQIGRRLLTLYRAMRLCPRQFRRQCHVSGADGDGE